MSHKGKKPLAKTLHHFHYDRFAANEENFRPRNGHRIVEIHQPVTGGDAQLDGYELSESQLSPWFQSVSCGDDMKHQTLATDSKTEDTVYRLRLLHFSPRKDKRSVVPLAVSSRTFKDMFTTLKLPALFSRVLVSGLPMALQFDPKLHGGREDSIGLVIRTDAFSFAQYTLCLIHNTKTRSTIAVCIGLREGEYIQFLDYLRGAMHCCGHTLLLPMVLVDFMKQSTARWLTYNRLSLLAIANSKEVNVRELEDDRGHPADQKLDLDSATRKLTFLNDEFSITESISKTQMRILDFMEVILIEQKDSPTFENSLDADAAYTFLDEIPYLRESFKSSLQYIERDRQNIQGLAQTTYCLIAQRESRQNLVIAEASRKIADESRKVAMWTRRDSTDMRIITAITLIFLPGTFTATLLGSNLFDFQAHDTRAIASSYSWIYWIITGILTALVLFAWFIVSRLQNIKMVRQMAQEDQAVGMQQSQQQYHAGPYTITGFWTTRGASGVWGESAIKGRKDIVWSGGGDCGASILSADGGGGCGGCGAGCGGGCGGA